VAWRMPSEGEALRGSEPLSLAFFTLTSFLSMWLLISTGDSRDVTSGDNVFSSNSFRRRRLQTIPVIAGVRQIVN